MVTVDGWAAAWPPGSDIAYLIHQWVWTANLAGMLGHKSTGINRVRGSRSQVEAAGTQLHGTAVRHEWYPAPAASFTERRTASRTAAPSRAAFLLFSAAALRQLDQCRDPPLQLHLEAAARLPWLDPHPLDQSARDLQRLAARGGIGERLAQRRECFGPWSSPRT